MVVCFLGSRRVDSTGQVCKGMHRGPRLAPVSQNLLAELKQEKEQLGHREGRVWNRGAGVGGEMASSEDGGLEGRSCLPW